MTRIIGHKDGDPRNNAVENLEVRTATRAGAEAGKLTYNRADRLPNFHATLRLVTMLQDHRCFACWHRHRLTRHHVVPVSRGGGDYLENVVGLCWTCHRAVHKPHYRFCDQMAIGAPVMSFAMRRIMAEALRQPAA